MSLINISLDFSALSYYKYIVKKDKNTLVKTLEKNCENTV